MTDDRVDANPPCPNCGKATFVVLSGDDPDGRTYQCWNEYCVRTIRQSYGFSVEVKRDE